MNDGDIVGIWGGGPIGQCSIKWALLKGAKKVFLIDMVQDRLDFAIKENGADKVVGINASGGKNVVEEILKQVPKGLGKFPRVLNVTGSRTPRLERGEGRTGVHLLFPAPPPPPLPSSRFAPDSPLSSF